MASKNKNKSTATAVDQEPLPMPASKPGRFTRLGAVAVPQLKIKDGDTVYVKFTAPLVTNPKKTKSGALATDEDGSPITIDIASVINLDTGELMHMVSGKALSQRLREYRGGNDKYVGLCFEITKKAKENGKRWKEYEVYEIDGTPAGEGKV